MADTLKVRRKRKNEEYLEKYHQERKRAFRYVRLTTRVFDEFLISSPPYKLCSRCGKITSKGYHYNTSSIGEIWLCQPCNYKVRHPDGKKIKIIYNAVETSRRNH